MVPGGRADSVTVIDGQGKEKDIKCSQFGSIVLTAGAIHTPKLLTLSGKQII